MSPLTLTELIHKQIPNISKLDSMTLADSLYADLRSGIMAPETKSIFKKLITSKNKSIQSSNINNSKKLSKGMVKVIWSDALGKIFNENIPELILDDFKVRVVKVHGMVHKVVK